MKVLFLIGFSLVCSWFSVGEAAENEERRKYLELRDINYDFAQKYREYLELRASGNHRESRKAAKAFKKRLNSYLLRVPSSEALQDPNGYYSSPKRFGFNPLLWKPINDLYSSKSFVTSGGNPGAFTAIDETSVAPIPVDPAPSGSSPVASEPDSIQDINAQGLRINTANPLSDSSPLSATPNTASYAGLDAEEGAAPMQEIASADELDLPADPAERFPRAVRRYTRGTGILADGLDTLETMLQNTHTLIASGSPDLQTLAEHRRKIEEGMGKLQHIDSILSRFRRRLGVAAKSNELDSSDLREPTRIHSELHRELLLHVEAFENMLEKLGNPYDHMTDEAINHSFMGAAEALQNSTLHRLPSSTIPISRPRLRSGVPRIGEPSAQTIEAGTGQSAEQGSQ